MLLEVTAERYTKTLQSSPIPSTPKEKPIKDIQAIAVSPVMIAIKAHSKPEIKGVGVVAVARIRSVNRKRVQKVKIVEAAKIGICGLYVLSKTRIWRLIRYLKV